MEDDEIIGIISTEEELLASLEPTAEIHVSVTSVGGGVASDYVHPETHSAESIVETETKQFVTTIERVQISELIQKESYVHDQIMASKMWVINHPMGRYPSVTVVDSGGNQVAGEIRYESLSQIRLLFSAEFSGKAYLN